MLQHCFEAGLKLDCLCLAHKKHTVQQDLFYWQPQFLMISTPIYAHICAKLWDHCQFSKCLPDLETLVEGNTPYRIISCSRWSRFWEPTAYPSIQQVLATQSSVLLSVLLQHHRAESPRTLKAGILCPPLTGETEINITFQNKRIKASQISK